MEEQNLVAIFTVILAVVVAVSASFSQGELEATGYFLSDGERIGELELELAETTKEKREGLMNRSKLAENYGMLFIFDDEQIRAFWMKSTYIPLDIVYIASNNTVMDVMKAYPEPGTPDSELTRYIGGPAKYVLEVNQNFTDRNGIEEGDRFYFNRTG
ncbi:MAG: DUF192 domain-containing protein [Candidatus Nanohaloarchaea archaeon]